MYFTGLFRINKNSLTIRKAKINLNNKYDNGLKILYLTFKKGIKAMKLTFAYI